MHKTARPHWLEELENEINTELKKQFKDKGLKVNLKLEYDIITPLSDRFEDKRLMLTNQVGLTASYDSTAESTTADEAKAGKLISEKISKRLNEKGMFP